MANNSVPCNRFDNIYLDSLKYSNTRWFKYDRDKLWLIYIQIVPVIFEPPCRFVQHLTFGNLEILETVWLFINKQEMQSMYNVILRRVHVTTVAVEMQQVLHISVCVCARTRVSACTCVRVALLIQHANRWRIVICGLSGSTKFFHIIS